MPEPQPIILLVDDEESLLEVTSIILEGEGYVTATANGVKPAIELLKTISPDLIISDITMPELTGYDFFQHVRSLPHMQNIPFIFMTAHSDVESVKKGKELGIDDYLTKPVDVHILLSTIRGKLRRREMLSNAFSQQMDQMKNQLFKMISHEMRTPLTAILGATEILSDSKDTLDSEDFTTFLTMLQASSKRLNGMVEDFLLAMKIESNQIFQELELQNIHINAKLLIDRLLLDYETQIRSKKLIVENNVPDEIVNIIHYAPHLDTIVQRILENAIKFSEDGQKVIVELQNQQDSYTFSICDYGCGIPKEKQADMFQKFYQVNRDKQEQQGSGLGLYIANRLAVINKSSITFESTEGKGSKFFITVPKNNSPLSY